MVPMNPAPQQGSQLPFRPRSALKLVLLATLTVALALAAMIGLGARGTGADPSLDAEEQAFLTLINDYRVQNSLAPLATDCRLHSAADWFANDMATDDYWPVNHFDNEDPPRNQAGRAAAFGFNASIAENIAGGFETAEAVFQEWQGSPGHNSNMLGNYVVIGIGLAFDPDATFRWYWVTDFAATIPPPAQPECGSTPTPTPAPTPTPTPVPTGTFEVSKDFDDDATSAVTVAVSCDNSATPDQVTKSVTELAPAAFTISLPAGSANCTATESPVPPGYIEDNTDCASKAVTASVTTQCTNVNTNYCAGVPWPVPSGDDDCDGTTSAAEIVIGTDPNDPCGASAWPPDFDDNLVINSIDVFKLLPPTFGTVVPPTSVRRDLFPSGVINSTDVFRVLPPFLGASCTP